MLQRLAVTNPKNDKMDPHGVNPTLSIFLPTPFPVAMQGLGATAPWEKDLCIPCLEIIVFCQLENWNRTFKRVSSKVICKIILPRIHCFDQMENWNRTFKKRVVKKETQDFRRLLFIHQIKIRMLKGLSIGRFQSWQKVRKFKIVNRINGSKYQLSYIKKNYLYSDFVQSLTCRSCKSSVISYNQDFRDLRSYPSTTIISNYH